MELAPHLNPHIFDDDVERVANRDGYGDGLKEAGEKDPNVVALSADLTSSTRTNVFADAFPERFLQVGIAEQNMASVASGMASMGKIPFIASYAMFSPGRSWEQVRTTIAYNDANVKIIGAHAGVSVGPDGATHQAIEDIALMRTLPNMTVIAPCDVHEARKAVLFAAEYDGPVYIRLAREKTPVITTEESPFTCGRAEIMCSRDTSHERTVGIISTGILTHQALVAAKELNESGIGASVLHLATIKPLDTKAIATFAAEHQILITLEEHQIAGGMGSAVAEFLSGTEPKRIIRLGVHDQFGQSGEPEELIAFYGMDAASVVKAANAAF
ncbi:MAG: transketolase C-terminal domain-containing protein [Candidatus Paceibacterota bacterium]